MMYLVLFLKLMQYEYIYKHERLTNYKRYAELVIESIYQTLLNCYRGQDTLRALDRYRDVYPVLLQTFKDWLLKHSDVGRNDKKNSRYHNQVLYWLNNRTDYAQAIVDYISGMTDNFAIRIFNEITTF